MLQVHGEALVKHSRAKTRDGAVPIATAVTDLTVGAAASPQGVAMATAAPTADPIVLE